MKRRVLCVAGVLAASALVAQAGPPAMDPIVFPVDTASIGTVIAAAGAAILLLVLGYRVAFSLVRRLASKMQRAV